MIFAQQLAVRRVAQRAMTLGVQQQHLQQSHRAVLGVQSTTMASSTAVPSRPVPVPPRPVPVSPAGPKATVLSASSLQASARGISALQPPSLASLRKPVVALSLYKISILHPPASQSDLESLKNFDLSLAGIKTTSSKFLALPGSPLEATMVPSSALQDSFSKVAVACAEVARKQIQARAHRLRSKWLPLLPLLKEYVQRKQVSVDCALAACRRYHRLVQRGIDKRAHCRRMVYVMAQFARAYKDRHTFKVGADYAAVRDYTDGPFWDINGALRTGKGMDASMEKRVNAIVKAITKKAVTVHQGMVYRGSDFFPGLTRQDLVVGATFCDKGFLSSSADRGQSFKKDITFFIQSVTGRRVQRFSSYKDENEVLFLPKTMFRITEVLEETRRDGEPVVVVHMKEMV